MSQYNTNLLLENNALAWGEQDHMLDGAREAISEIMGVMHRTHPLEWLQNHSYVASALVMLGVKLVVDGGAFGGSDKLEDEFRDARTLIVDLGDMRVKARSAQNFIEIDDIFGNEFIKEKDKPVTDKNVQETGDPVAAGAVNPMAADVKFIDMNPEANVYYTPQAQAAGIEGMVMLEVVVAADGKVLRARPVGKKLGYGLDEVAQKVYESKKYKIAMAGGQAPVKIKFFKPIIFKLK